MDHYYELCHFGFTDELVEYKMKIEKNLYMQNWEYNSNILTFLGWDFEFWTLVIGGWIPQFYGCPD